MHVIIFGNGPIPVEKNAAVTAPGGRTWQIIRTVAAGMAENSTGPHSISLLALDDRADAKPYEVAVSVQRGSVSLRYMPLGYEKFRALGTGIQPQDYDLELDANAAVGCASAQPYSTAASFASMRNLPLWIDVFGDPICEWQTQAATNSDSETSENQQVHIWKLLLDGLLGGDRFSTLSQRQRYALLGQLGCAGRLNQFTAEDELAHSIPYGVFLDELPEMNDQKPGTGTFNILWCGSFNTWMDVDTLAAGILAAMRQNPLIRLTVVGGQVPGYNEISYGRFVAAVKAADLTGSVQLLDWQPIGKMAELYRQAHLGLSIDRFCYEAHLGSRTRIVNFMAHGLPVVSTAVSEITEELAGAELLLTFELGNAQDLTRVLVEAASQTDHLAERAHRCREYISARFDGFLVGRPLITWIKNPTLAGDRSVDEPTGKIKSLDNDLTNRWKNLRHPLGL